MADDPKPTDAAELARRWIAELDEVESDQRRKRWIDRCKRIQNLYAESPSEGVPVATTKKRFALFWANIEVLKPAVLARMPTAVVTRRFRDPDPVARLASEVLERALNFSEEEYDFAAVLKGCRDEYLLFGQGVAWVRYIPTMRTESGAAKSDQIADDPETYEVVDWEDVRADYVNFRDFYHGSARQWTEVPWVARCAYLTRQELIDRFGDEIGKKVPLDYSPPERPEAPDSAKKAAVYEIWDRCTKKAIWISKGYTTAPLDERDDPLKLKDFFPCPKPALGTITPDSIIPTPDYIYYQDQCEEIDNLTTRIDQLIDALRVRGFYAGERRDDLNTLLTSDNRTLIPVDSWAMLKEGGGVAGLIEWFPIEQVATVLKECFDARRQLIDDVYQVTGISDIARGDTDPDETATAQKLKAGFGSARAAERKHEMARLARDILQIKGEVIASRFDPKTLAQMTGVQLLTAQERATIQQQLAATQALAQQQAQAAAAAGQPAPPPPPPPVSPQQMAQLQQPTWDDVEAVLRNPMLRLFRIDIETDSTVEPNDQEEKQRRIEFMQAVGKYLADSLPVVQAAPPILPVIAQGLLFLARGFRVGREMEEVIQKAMDDLQAAAAAPKPPPPPDPKAQAAATSAQASVMQAQNDSQANQIEAARVASDHALGMAQVEAENTRTTATYHADMQQAVLKSQERRLTHEINSTQPMTAPTR